MEATVKNDLTATPSSYLLLSGRDFIMDVRDSVAVA
jgi:hypothetical protein